MKSVSFCVLLLVFLLGFHYTKSAFGICRSAGILRRGTFLFPCDYSDRPSDYILVHDMKIYYPVRGDATGYYAFPGGVSKDSVYRIDFINGDMRQGIITK